MQKKPLSGKYYKIKRIFLLILLVPVSFLLLNFINNYFSIRNIEVNGLKKIDSFKGADLWSKKNIFLLSEEEIEKNLLAVNPLFKKVNVYKRYPNTLRLVIQKHEPFVYLSVYQGYFMLSDDARILSKSKTKENDLPVINYYQKLSYNIWQSGDFIKYKDIASALHFLRKTLDLGLEIYTIDISGTNMIALNLKDQTIFFTTEKDPSIQDYQVETIIRQFKITGKNFATLDLRFDKPIIQFR